MAERTCIVTRSVREPGELIRFVAGPDGMVVPDLKNNLPGRGVWVTASRAMVDEAVAKKAFARGLKAPVKADKNLGEQVDSLLSQIALGALGFARKAGECTTGSGKVETALARGKAIGILHASDAAPDGVRKMASSIRAAQENSKRTIIVWQGFSSMQLDLALGATNVIHAALTRGGAAKNCLRCIARLAAYRENAVGNNGERGEEQPE
ncbi:RNA-binding protein [Pseudahrensia aquimaris]|uniref:RNA-binding protein n=1 Tax=Pseudahrensia aquimaris TaxID=744461 RepID=A0ABW3FG01_9HYPH